MQQEAEHLFATRPDLYKDPNHKPELAIALTPFTALCGFRPHEEIYFLLKRECNMKLYYKIKMHLINILPLFLEHNSLQKLIGLENIENLHKNQANGLKKCFSSLMLSSHENIIECIQKLSEEFKTNTSDSDTIVKHFHTLNRDFPNDVGILCLFFLNIIELQPGQAIFLPAQIPHAYLSGDCIECMACSDNVIRAGLTPKFKDIDTLLAMLNYTGTTGEQQLFHPNNVDKYRQVFAPNVEDFAVVKISVSNL